MQILSVSPAACDHSALKRFLGGSGWKIYEAFTLSAGVALLRRDCFHVLICEQDLRPGSWKAMLAEAALLQRPPYVIVTSRVADDYLWAEALNLGAYDVLSKPLESAEVLRVVDSAWLHWDLGSGAAAKSLKVTAGLTCRSDVQGESRHMVAGKGREVLHEDVDSRERGCSRTSGRY